MQKTEAQPASEKAPPVDEQQAPQGGQEPEAEGGDGWLFGLWGGGSSPPRRRVKVAAEPGVGTTVDGEVQGATKDEVPLGKNEVPLAKARLVRAPSPPPRSGLLPSWMEGSVVSEPHSKSKSMVSVASETEAR